LPQSPLQSAAQLKQRFLDSHNKIRRQFGVPDLVWDNNLAAYAQRWANHLRDRKQCKMEHRSSAGITEGKRYGENLAWNWTSRVQQSFDKSPEFAVENWSKECKDYNFQSNKCSGVCGHFTQVIWKKSQRVGCAVATCNQGGHSEIWVCNYDPPGNYINESPL
jgi:uncharacterized protein YkwD